MPNMTGVDLLKKLHAAGMALPAIMISGTMPTEELNQHPWLPIEARINKPYTLAEFLGTVKNVLREAGTVPAQFAPDENEPVAESVIAPVRDGMNSPHRVLVVDDDCAARQFSIQALAGSGYDADGVKDGAAGWEALQTCDYDLVITDNQMPRMTGIEMIAKLRSARMTVPVIMATRCLPTEEFDRKPWLEPDLTLERPFSNDDLLAAVKEILGPDDGRDDVKESLLPQYL